MKGRIFKFRLETEPINNDMDNFLFNIVLKRNRQQIFLSKGRVLKNSLLENDYIFIQSNGLITHYMKCKSQGPLTVDQEIEISVKDIIKISNPIKSTFKGQGYNNLNRDDLNKLLI